MSRIKEITIMNKMFLMIEKYQGKAIALNDLKTAMQLNWLKYSMSQLTAYEVFNALQKILIKGESSC